MTAPTSLVLKAAVASWLPPELSELRRCVVAAAFCDVGEVEEPLGSNRGPYVDRVNDEGGSPAGSYWCANALARWFRHAGADTPGPGRDGSCDEWIRFGTRTKTWRDSLHKPQPGDAVIYGKQAGEKLDGQHCGVVVRSSPLVLTIEGNTGMGGKSRNGVGVDLGELDRGWVLGYVVPRGRTL